MSNRQEPVQAGRSSAGCRLNGRRFYPAIAAVLVASLMLPAATYRHKGCGLSLWLPDDWEVDSEQDTLLASSMDDDATLELTALGDAASLGAAFDRYPDRLNKEIALYRETQARRNASINGMEGLMAGGEGIRAGAKQTIRVVVFKGPRGIVMLTWSAASLRGARHQAAWDRILGSMQPIRGPLNHPQSRFQSGIYFF